VIRAAEKATGIPVPFRFGPRREGDAAVLVADSSKLQKTLGWRPQYETLEAMVGTAWEFEQRRRRG
jgi:UDP-glucose 4-epimerase